MDRLKYLRNEKGLVLVVSLMLLITLTVMGLAAISTTTTEIKISGNERANAQAFHSAEAGIWEMLHRIALSPGSMITIDATTFDASIADPGWTPADCLTAPDSCPNPDWTASVFYTATEPADPDGNTDYTRTILPSSSWADINYATSDTNDPGMAVTIRYARESDYDGISNGDGDDDDLVFYDSTSSPPSRKPAVDTAASEDFNPPLGGDGNPLENDDAIRLVTVRGISGTAQKTVTVEMADFPINPNVTSAVQTDIQLNVRGSGFISGFNHKADTQPWNSGDQNNRDGADYQAGDCDNHSGGGDVPNAGQCGLAGDPEAGYTNPQLADYSGNLEASGHKPGVVYPAGQDPTTNGANAEMWGGDSNNDADGDGWKEEASGGFPELYDMLGITSDELDAVLQNANVTDANADTACPIGLTYIQNSGGQQYKPPTGCTEGSGVMVIEGDALFDGNFEFRGLIYVKEDAELRGTTWILGAVAVKGVNQNMRLQSGSPTILYSEQTVFDSTQSALAQAGFAFTFLSWKEY